MARSSQPVAHTSSKRCEQGLEPLPDAVGDAVRDPVDPVQRARVAACAGAKPKRLMHPVDVDEEDRSLLRIRLPRYRNS